MPSSFLSFSVVGGLGNQLFIIAAAFNMKSIISEVNLVLLRDTRTDDRPKCVQSFLADCPEIQKVLVPTYHTDANWVALGEHVASDVYTDYTVAIEENRRKGLSTMCVGYFQNLRYLPVRPRVLELFNIHEKQEVLRKKTARVVIPEATCAVHFRLGDYRKYPHVFPLLTDLYYSSGIKTVLKRKPQIDTLLVFVETDEYETVKARMKEICGDIECKVLFTQSLNLNTWEEVILMSLCSGVVMANSSFSWWGGYFNCQEQPAVVFPSQWTHSETVPPERALALPHWTKVSASGEVSDIRVSDARVSASGEVSDAICIDVGSHDGMDSLKIYRCYSTKVFGFEPHPRFFGVTVENTRHIPDIEILPYAVSDGTESFITLNESQGDQSHSILPFKSPEELNKYWPGCYAVHPSGRSFTVRQTRLDAFLDSRGYSPESLTIAHLHVDAQGVDLEVLKSLGKYLPCVKTGVVEVAKTTDTSSYQGQQGTISSAKEFLLANNFNVDAVRPNDVTEEISCEFNISFTRRGSD